MSGIGDSTEWEVREMTEKREAREAAARYVPTGVPLTERQAEVLDHLIEEASEVIHAASKLKRFGLDDPNPATGVPNTRTLGLEVGDLMTMIDLAMRELLVLRPDLVNGRDRKLERLKVYSRTLP